MESRFILSSGDISLDFFNKTISKPNYPKTLNSPKSIKSITKKINKNNRILFIPSGK